MVQEFNRHTFPPQGWTFMQPQTRWQNPMAMVGFDASVKAIIQHRLANKAIMVKHKLSTDYYAVADELERYTKLRLGIDPDPPQISFFQPSRSRILQREEAAAATSNLTRKISRIGTGIKTIKDWLGSNAKPVEQRVSDARAAVCSVCPMNIGGDWLSLFVKPVANIIKSQIEQRNKMKLTTIHDEKLGLCDACGCPLKLKVHVPIDIIRVHIQPEEFNKLHESCWIR